MENSATVLNNNGQLVVSSRQVAEGFGKEHSKIARSIESLLECIAKSGDTPSKLLRKVTESKIGFSTLSLLNTRVRVENLTLENLSVKNLMIESTFEVSGKQYPEYLLTRDALAY